jgi:hypothetical protein
MSASSASTTAQGIPPPSLNGGLYTGQPFADNAPWRNFPVPPDAGYYGFANLPVTSRDCPRPPADAPYHLPGGGLRPGNNTPNLPRAYTASRDPALNSLCIPREDPARTAAAEGSCPAYGFRQYSYL